MHYTTKNARNRTKVSKNFYLDEFVPKEIHDQFGASSLWFVRKDLIGLAQFYRDYFQRPIMINNWWNNGPYNERGFRAPWSNVGGKLSQHKLCGAFDCSVGGMSPNEVRSSILADPKTFLGKGLTTIEHEDYSPTWVHSDMRYTNMEQILIVKPAPSTFDSPPLILDYSIPSPAQDEYFILEDGELVPVIFRLFE